MKALLNYANGIYKSSQRENTRTGLAVGGFDRVFAHGPQDIARAFYQKNRRILRRNRGNGYWLWKFYFISQSLEQLNNGDFLFYCDSGSHFISSIAPLIELSLNTGQDVIPFETEAIEKVWTKRDAFRILNTDEPEFYETPQRMGGFMLFRKSRYTLEFTKELLEIAQDERLITDQKNQLGFPNHPGFVEHRHDQSIWSLMTKKRGLKAFRDPCQLGNCRLSLREDSPYGQLLELTRSTQLTKTGQFRVKLERNRNELIREGLVRFIRNKIKYRLSNSLRKK